jgi:hypothetical protein
MVNDSSHRNVMIIRRVMRSSQSQTSHRTLIGICHVFIILMLMRCRYSVRERNYLHSYSLLPSVRLSPWYVLYNNGSDEDFMAVTSLHRNGFEKLLSEFRKHYIIMTGTGRKGRPPRVRDHHCILAILLHGFCSAAESKTWHEMFGIAPATFSRLWHKGCLALMNALNALPEAAISWPTIDEQIALAAMVERKEPLIKGRWGFIDGKNYRIEQSGVALIQNATYNGWLHDVFVTGVACFSADGLVRWAKLNFFGSWNDGEMSRPFCEKLCNPAKNAPNHGVVSDTAFPVTNEMVGKIMTPLKEGDIEKAPQHLRAILLKISGACTSIRQGAEWGMGAVPKVYRILERKLPHDCIKRGLLLNVLYKLYNFRVRTTGISQIRNYFNSD